MQPCLYGKVHISFEKIRAIMPWCIVYFCLLLFCAYKTARHRHQQVILLVACNLVTPAIARCVLHQFEHWERWRREVTTLSLLLLDISKSGWLPGPSGGPSIHKESYILRMKVVCCLWCVFLSDWDTLPSFQTALAYLTYIYIYCDSNASPDMCILLYPVGPHTFLPDGSGQKVWSK